MINLVGEMVVSCVGFFIIYYGGVKWIFGFVFGVEVGVFKRFFDFFYDIFGNVFFIFWCFWNVDGKFFVSVEFGVVVFYFVVILGNNIYFMLYVVGDFKNFVDGFYSVRVVFLLYYLGVLIFEFGFFGF